MSVNKVTLVGYLGNDPDVKSVGSDQKVAQFSLATSDKWTDKQGHKQEKTEWHRIVCWNKLAEIAGKYLKKGRQVYVEGKITTESYEKDGETKYVTKIVAATIQMLGSAGERPGSNSTSSDQQQREEDGVAI